MAQYDAVDHIRRFCLPGAAGDECPGSFMGMCGRACRGTHRVFAQATQIDGESRDAFGSLFFYSNQHTASLSSSSLMRRVKALLECRLTLEQQRNSGRHSIAADWDDVTNHSITIALTSIFSTSVFQLSSSPSSTSSRNGPRCWRRRIFQK